MPPAYVKAIREEIFYEYAKLISKSAYGSLLQVSSPTGSRNFEMGKLLSRGRCGNGNERVGKVCQVSTFRRF